MSFVAQERAQGAARFATPAGRRRLAEVRCARCVGEHSRLLGLVLVVAEPSPPGTVELHDGAWRPREVGTVELWASERLPAERAGGRRVMWCYPLSQVHGPVAVRCPGCRSRVVLDPAVLCARGPQTRFAG